MKHTKITKYLTINFFILLTLVFQKYSSCQNSLNYSKNNYGLNDQELRAMLFGLNYDPSKRNKNNKVNRDVIKNESSLLLRNLINEETLSEKNDKVVNDIKNMNNSTEKKINSISKGNNNIHNINENQNANVELKTDNILDNTSEQDDINEKNNDNGDMVHKNIYNNILSDPYDINSTNAYINKSDITNLNYSSNDVINNDKVNKSYEEKNIVNNTELNKLIESDDHSNKNDINKKTEKNKTFNSSSTSDEKKQTDIKGQNKNDLNNEHIFNNNDINNNVQYKNKVNIISVDKNNTDRDNNNLYETNNGDLKYNNDLIKEGENKRNNKLNNYKFNMNKVNDNKNFNKYTEIYNKESEPEKQNNSNNNLGIPTLIKKEVHIKNHNTFSSNGKILENKDIDKMSDTSKKNDRNFRSNDIKNFKNNDTKNNATLSEDNKNRYNITTNKNNEKKEYNMKKSNENEYAFNTEKTNVNNDALKEERNNYKYLNNQTDVNINNLQERDINLYNKNESDKKLEQSFREEDIKNAYLPENKNFQKTLTNNEKNEDNKIPHIDPSNNELDKKGNYNKYEIGKIKKNNEENKQNVTVEENINPEKIRKDHEQNIQYSKNDPITDIQNSTNAVLKKIKPTEFENYTKEELQNVSSSEVRDDNLNEINRKGETNMFSEKSTLKKGENDWNEYEYFKLKSNELKVLGIINKYSPKGGFSISVNCGGYDDFREIPGISNLLRHAIFYKSEKRITTLLSELGKYSSENNSRIGESFTTYYAIGKSENIYNILTLFSQNLFYPLFDEDFIENEVREINNKYISMENNSLNCLKIISQFITDLKYSKFFFHGNYITLCNNVLKNGLNIKKLLYNFHKKCYQPKNMALTILLGKKGNSHDNYNMNDIENFVIDIFEKIKNYDYVNESNNKRQKEKHIVNFKDDTFNIEKKSNYKDSRLVHNVTQNNSKDKEEKIKFIEHINEFNNYVLDLNQKGRYIEVLKKEGWRDQIYLYWSSKISIDLYKKIEEYGSITFIHDILLDLRKNGLYDKICVENQYAYDLKIISSCNKYYVNYGILMNLTKKGKKDLRHLMHIINVFIKEISKLFDHDSLNKGINKYILDYYREKALITDVNYNNDNKYIELNDLINYSNILLDHSDDSSLILSINNLIEDKNKNDFRNHIKITSLLGSLMKNENTNIINVVDTFSIRNQSKIPYSNVTYVIGENPYMVNEGNIVNDINLILPEIKICPFNSLVNNKILFNEKSFFCVPYNSSENFEYSESEEKFISEENKHIFKSNILYNIPCLIKSSYGYNIYFKRGLTHISKVKTDFIFYFPSEKFTFYESVFTRIHIIILQKKIERFLSDYTTCSVNANIMHDAISYTLSIESNGYFFEEFFNKIQELLSLKEIPSRDEYNEAYDELNIIIQTDTTSGVDKSLKIMYSLFNKYTPTNKEMYDILNAYFFYPSYNAYRTYVNEYFLRNYVVIFIYGNIIISDLKGEENITKNNNNIFDNKKSMNYNEGDATDKNNNSNNNNVESANDSTNYYIYNENNSSNRDTNKYTDNDYNNNNNNNNNNKDGDKYLINEKIYEGEENKKNPTTYLKKQEQFLEKQENNNKEEENKSKSLQISYNGSGIEYLVKLCESFISKVTNKVIKKSESTYYTKKLINDEDIEIDMHDPGQDLSNSITVSYIIDSETLLNNVLINIIVDLISSDFIKFVKIKYNDGYVVEVRTFFTYNGLGGLLFIIQSFDKDVEQLESDICTFVKYITFQLLNIDISDLKKQLQNMKEHYIMNNTIFTFNQEYSSILDELITGHECFDKKYKIVQIFDELINCPNIILNKINYILRKSKKNIFKEYKKTNIVNIQSSNKDGTKGHDYLHLNEKCNYSYRKNMKMSNIQFSDNSELFIKKQRKKKYKYIPSNGTTQSNNIYKKEHLFNFSNFVEIKEKGFFKYIISYFRKNNRKYLNDDNYLDFESCDEEMSKDNFQIFYNFTNDINKIREYFRGKFTNDKEVKENCSINYEEIRKYCYDHNINKDNMIRTKIEI
ncbi:peptidase [Plasmodium falciparum NF54]|uniref:Peptidase M16, putative n=2 Tax=Plasmodium falciparum TaxID=5833 RepID=Q8IIE8_PLAF7|nr:peptidase M16, putative [Plasmodium falciparum 3D7]EWC87958.1 hypothetical protein PFNF54_03189 [Plasmodium falciparum NF54]KAF4331202.1 peptidase [Plasmodium falciparum NF54]PKC49272.1 peptidase [Plasmodium falciparum NF54]CZT98880.1 peptidase M16, putative [Plasmodium falciparum 3D7]|eukprot:XP_001347897.1 petidase, M16 family [Plasmodium falciparum 3D7]